MTETMHPDFLQTESATILVVDDQPINIQTIYQILGPQYKILMATSGPQAIAVCKKSMPDLVLMDVVMPEQDGLTTCRLMKEDTDIANIPVIFVTGLQQQSDEDACWEAGAVDFLQKPVNASTLRYRVKAHLTLKRQSDLLRSLAYLDGLTGVYNRRYFNDYFQSQLANSKRLQQPLSIILIDIDHFKQYNDQFGHLAGDDALKLVAKTLKACCHRPADLLARYGGEEFICVLPNTDLAGALHLADRMLKAVAMQKIDHPTVNRGIVTISLGIATGTGAESDLVKLADTRLYQAKLNGRNQYNAGNNKANSPATAKIS